MTEKKHEGHEHKDEQAQMLMQQQVQVLMAQKEALQMQLVELNKALEELEKTRETEVYRMSGPILIKSTKAATKKDLGDKKKLIQERLDMIEKSTKRLLHKGDDKGHDVVKSSDQEIKVGG